MTYKLQTNYQSNSGGIEERFEKIEDAVEAFKISLREIGDGGYVGLSKALDNGHDYHVVSWISHCNGDYVTGVTWEIEGLDCENEDCLNTSENYETYCLDCQKKALDIFLTNLIENN